MRREVETFEDGQKSVRYFNEAEDLCRIETFDADDNLKISIEYIFDEAEVNVERIVRDADGTILRRIMFDDKGEELGSPDGGKIRWRLMDGTDDGVDVKGQERIGDGIDVEGQEGIGDKD